MVSKVWRLLLLSLQRCSCQCWTEWLDVLSRNYKRVLVIMHSCGYSFFLPRQTPCTKPNMSSFDSLRMKLKILMTFLSSMIWLILEVFNTWCVGQDFYRILTMSIMQMPSPLWHIMQWNALSGKWNYKSPIGSSNNLPGLNYRQELVQQNWDVGQVVKSVLKHVVFWVDCKWKYPKAASTEFKNFAWLSTISTKFFGGLEEH